MYNAGLSREAIFGRTCTTLVLKGLKASSAVWPSSVKSDSTVNGTNNSKRV